MTHTTSHNGAGVLLITIINNEKYIILAEERSHVYSDFGGRRDDGEDVALTASRELFEESRTMFKINPEKLGKQLYVDKINKKDKKYRLYIVCTNNVQEYEPDDFKKVFHKNYKKAKALGKHYMETNDVTFVSLDKIKKTISKNKNTVTDYYSKKIVLRDRILNILIDNIHIIEDIANNC